MRYVCICLLFLSWPVRAEEFTSVHHADSLRLAFSGPMTQKMPDKLLGRDKAKHFMVSMLLTGASGWMLQHRLHHSVEMSRPTGAAFVLSLGIIKEILDQFTPGNRFSWKDIAADLLGVITGGLLLTW